MKTKPIKMKINNQKENYQRFSNNLKVKGKILKIK